MTRKRGEIMAKCSRDAVEKYGGEFGMVALVTENEQHLRALVKGIYEFIDSPLPDPRPIQPKILPQCTKYSLPTLTPRIRSC